MADILKISKSSVENHLNQLGYIKSFVVWFPHKWEKKKKKNLLDHISACDFLFKHSINVFKANRDGQ